MPKAKPDPELVAQARELVAMGASLREAASTLGVSAPTIKRWIDEPAPTPPAPAELPAHMRPPEAPPPLPAVDLDDPIALVKQLINEQRQTIHAMSAAGVHGTSKSSAASVLEKLVKTLKQLQEGERRDADGVVVPTAEVERTRAALLERIKAHTNSPLMCAECSRELSVFWGTGLTEAQLNAEDPDTSAIAKPA